MGGTVQKGASSIPMRLLIIGCEILYREISLCAAQSKNVVDARFLRKGLHDVGEREMSATLQAEIDQVPPDKYEAILLGYGLCSNGIRGLNSKHLPLVVPKAHDCITLLLGSKERYRDHFEKHPGTYFRSTGWLERNVSGDGQEGRFLNQLGFGKSFEELVAKFGEDNAKYIVETLGNWDWKKNYDTLAYIDMGIGEFPQYEEMARREASEKKWAYEKLAGDIGLLLRLVDGQWDASEFLVVPPGQKIVPIYVGDIIRCEMC
jgi:hypothetical protein